MNQIYSEISQVLNATPEQVNTLLSEYRDGSRAIAPQQYFLDMQTLDNEGNNRHIVAVRMNLSGTPHQFEELVLEEIPLRTIVEYDHRHSAIIAIVVEATGSVDKTRVTIYTIDTGSPFLADFIGALFVPASLTRIYNEESRNLSEQIQKFVGMPQAS